MKAEHPDLYDKVKEDFLGGSNGHHRATTLNISSCPSGADIEVDGAFVGNTPSSVLIPLGEHSIKMTKAGYRCWRRELKARRGLVTVAARLKRSIH